MFKMIAATLLLTSAGVALGSDASFDQRQLRDEKASPAQKDAGAKAEAPRGPAACTCQHARS